MAFDPKRRCASPSSVSCIHQALRLSIYARLQIVARWFEKHPRISVAMAFSMFVFVQLYFPAFLHIRKQVVY